MSNPERAEYLALCERMRRLPPGPDRYALWEKAEAISKGAAGRVEAREQQAADRASIERRLSALEGRVQRQEDEARTAQAEE
jgi:hypothetical protein